MEEIDLQAHAASEVYSEWFRIWCENFFKHMLPGITTGQRFERLMEIEEDVISLTNTKDHNEAMDRHAIVEPRARLQKLTEHMRKLTERYIPGTPKSQLQLLVLDILAVKKEEFIDEVARLEAVREQKATTQSPTFETGDGQNPGDQSPLADPAINETDERTETPFTDPRASVQTRDSESAVTEERVKSLIQEFVNDAVKPWKKKAKRVAVQAFKMAETTRNDLGKANERITKVEVNYRDDNVLYDVHLRRTVALEDTTSKLVDDLERVISLEEKNASLEERNTKLEANLKAVTEQVNELIKAKLAADKAVEKANAQAAKELQDALDEETWKTKEAPRLSDAELAERARNVADRNPKLVKIMAAKQAEEANRLKAQQDTYHNFEKAHKKITDTIVDTSLNPALQTEDDFEEDLEQQPTRQRVFNAVPVSTVAQPFSPHKDTT
ncbi:uncharacterized protein LOC124909621 [Impatiens glandulifera]|uniref:uncharacterized protein LOC124909621 n=1 Tax=Impatiens glandulifera TaxID=253017 RepID=UPI001FB09EDA|nr:uncharacterized protein LOC124909621 [Impatiens glandulifera]